MCDSEPRLLARSAQGRMRLTLVPEQFGGQPFLVPAGPVVDSAYDLVLYEREQVLQESLRPAGPRTASARTASRPWRARRGADAARRSRRFGSVRHAVDTASTSPSTVPNAR